MSVWKTRCTLQRTKAAVENEAESFLFILYFIWTHEFPKAVEFLHHLQYEKDFLPPFAASTGSPEAQRSLFFNYLVMAKVLHGAFFTLIF